MSDLKKFGIEIIDWESDKEVIADHTPQADDEKLTIVGPEALEIIRRWSGVSEAVFVPETEEVKTIPHELRKDPAKPPVIKVHEIPEQPKPLMDPLYSTAIKGKKAWFEIMRNDKATGIHIRHETPREYFLDDCRKIRETIGSDADLDLLHIRMSCGKDYAFKAEDDIPQESLKCECGEEYVILYEKL